MTGKLIALESNDRGLLQHAALHLADLLRKEGYDVETMVFPQKAHSSSYFINQYESCAYGQVNPYVASMFYALDRFEAAKDIRNQLQKGTTVICSGYIGSTLASLGAEFTDASVRKSFYMWAYSLETGTFSVPQPDISIVISENPATLTELCQQFPKDFVLQTNTNELRQTVATILPIHKTEAPLAKQSTKVEKSISNYYQLLSRLNPVEPLTYSPIEGQYYKPKHLQAAQTKTYAQGLVILNKMRDDILKNTPKEYRLSVERSLTPLGTKINFEGKGFNTRYKRSYKSALQALLDEHIPHNYGPDGSGVQTINISHRNELGLLPNILFEITGANVIDAMKTLADLPYEIKGKMLEAYADDVKSGGVTGKALGSVMYEFEVVASHTDLLEFKSMFSKTAIAVQEPSPRYGYDMPEGSQNLTEKIESYFDEALNLYNKLSNCSAAPYCVLLGHKNRAHISFNALTALDIVSADTSSYSESLSTLVKNLQTNLRTIHPILFG